MGRRSRIIGYGGSLVLVLVGAVLAAARTDAFGMAASVALVSIGLVLATSLVFYEVGLSEDRERARDAAARRPPPEPSDDAAPRPPARRLVRPGRSRGSR